MKLFEALTAGLRMAGNRRVRRVGLSGLVLASLLTPAGVAGSAGGYQIQFCAQIPIVGGIPPWGFHTGAPITTASGSYARGHGEIDLADNTVSGILCQVDRVEGQPDRLLVMTVEPGFAGQGFMADQLQKVQHVANKAAELGRKNLLIAVDGGIVYANPGIEGDGWD